jgi:hypothetical protein
MKTKITMGIALLLAGGLLTACSNDDDYAINTNPIVSSVSTGEAVVSAVSADVSGAVSSLKGQASSAYTVGILYSTSEDPKTGSKATATLSDDKFTASITGLSTNVTYHYCAFVTLQNAVTYYGEVKSFVTTNAQVVTGEASDVTAVAAKLSGSISGIDGLPSSTKISSGMMVSKEDSSTIDGSKLYANATTAAGNFSTQGDGYVPSNKYNCRAYLKLNDGYVFGEQKTFTTADQNPTYVDLGLSVQWASCNLGATTPSGLGGYFGYGDITGLQTSTNVVLYGTAADIYGNGAYDICAKNLRGRLPNFAEMKELFDNTTHEWTSQDGVAGMKFTAKNGNSIFLPAAGQRKGMDMSETGSLGLYWAGAINQNATDYAYTMSLTSDKATWGSSARYMGLSIRPVLKTSISFDNSKLLTGDIENKGNYRMEIYNQWGSGTKDNPGLDPNTFGFSKRCYVNFTVSGLGKLSSPVTAYIVFADGSWSTQQWNAGNKGDCQVTGDGTYTVYIDGVAKGLNVFCVDLVGLGSQISDMSGVNAYVNSIIVDTDNTTDVFTCGGSKIDNSKLIVGDLEGKGNLRCEVYNEYGKGTKDNPPFDRTQVSFASKFAITFTVSGLGTLMKSYPCYLVFADGTWTTQQWNAGNAGDCQVTGDGTYTVWVKGSGSSLTVCCIDIVGIGSGENIANVKVKLDGVYWK